MKMSVSLDGQTHLVIPGRYAGSLVDILLQGVMYTGWGSTIKDWKRVATAPLITFVPDEDDLGGAYGALDESRSLAEKLQSKVWSLEKIVKDLEKSKAAVVAAVSPEVPVAT